jgi:ABC-type Mn2+/Zn2+ transport system permease subunit
MSLLILGNPTFLPALALSAAIGVACAVLSVFVVLRKWAYIGEGISHAGYGGAGTAAVIALVSPVLAGDGVAYATAVLFCVATAVAIAFFSRRRAVSGDAAIGVFVVASLAWGLIAFSIRAHQVHGVGAESGWDQFLIGRSIAFSAPAVIAGVCASAGVLLAVAMLSKEILAYCFDPVLAEVSGVPAGFVHYLLIVLLAVMILVAMRLAGALLAPAFVVLPGATALAISARLRTVMILAIAGTLLAVALGLAATLRWPFLPAGAAIVLVLFVEFLAATLWKRRAATA